MSQVFTGQFNGYSVADRQLEDVMFDVTFTLDKEAKTVTLDSVILEALSLSYVEGLGPKGTVQFWCDEVRTCIEDDLVSNFWELCETSISEEDDAWIEQNLLDNDEGPEPVQVEKVTMESLF